MTTSREEDLELTIYFRDELIRQLGEALEGLVADFTGSEEHDALRAYRGYRQAVDNPT